MIQPIVRLDQIDVAQRIAVMGVETGRDDDEIGRERLDARQDHGLHRLAEGFAAVARPERRIDDLVMLAALADRSGAGIVRHLMGGSVHDGRIVPEDVLRAVAVMDVEIDDRDPLGAVRGLRRAARRWPRC